MGNCQAIDNASLIIQHPGGRSEMLYWPITASEVMKSNPGHYVALLLTTTLYNSPSVPSTTTKQSNNSVTPINKNNNQPLRVTRIKLLRPTDMLTLGHAYRLITTQEVMKGLWEKKHGKKMMRNKVQPQPQPQPESDKGMTSDFASRSGLDNTHLVRKHEKQRARTSSASASKGWHPSLNSISEASS